MFHYRNPHDLPLAPVNHRGGPVTVIKRYLVIYLEFIFSIILHGQIDDQCIPNPVFPRRCALLAYTNNGDVTGGQVRSLLRFLDGEVNLDYI